MSSACTGCQTEQWHVAIATNNFCILCLSCSGLAHSIRIAFEHTTKKQQGFCFCTGMQAGFASTVHMQQILHACIIQALPHHMSPVRIQQSEMQSIMTMVDPCHRGLEACAAPELDHLLNQVLQHIFLMFNVTLPFCTGQVQHHVLQHLAVTLRGSNAQLYSFPHSRKAVVCTAWCSCCTASVGQGFAALPQARKMRGVITVCPNHPAVETIVSP